jgi:hypothetical protein
MPCPAGQGLVDPWSHIVIRYVPDAPPGSRADTSPRCNACDHGSWAGMLGREWRAGRAQEEEASTPCGHRPVLALP